MRIFLLGFMGAGKTTIGLILSKKLNWSFIDVDLFIENRFHKTIVEIFDEKGENGFREIERRVLQEISGFEKIVVSTGGGLPCFFDNMELMNKSGITIYLKSNTSDLIKRMCFDKQKRPLIRDKSKEEIRDFVEINLIKREQFYKRAEIVFDVPSLNTKKEIDELVDELLIKLSV